MIKNTAFVAATLLLCACGGGGASSENDTSKTPNQPASNTPMNTNTTNPAQDNTSSTTTTNTAPEASKKTCKNDTLDDVWMNNRLGCVAINQKLLSNAITDGFDSDKTLVDTAIMPSQGVYNAAFNNIIGTDGGRYFQRLICITNTPKDYFNFSAKRLTLATDLAVGFGLGNFVKIKGVSTSPISVKGFYSKADKATVLPAVEETCSAAKHPIIVDFQTGRITVINDDALSKLIITNVSQ